MPTADFYAAITLTAPGRAVLLHQKTETMKITYYGHSCFSVVAGGKTILFDPFISGNELASGIDPDDIRVDYIFVSHGHFDQQRCDGSRQLGTLHTFRCARR
jgi:glyoxylase-like metal-dependent hydrolase (beta-lactamase superfamily II)